MTDIQKTALQLPSSSNEKGIGSEVPSSLNTTAITEDMNSDEDSPEGNVVVDVEESQSHGNDEEASYFVDHFFWIPRVEKLPWHIFLFQT